MGWAINSFVGKSAAMVTPFIIETKNVHSWLPGTIFGVVGILGGLLAIGIPESRGNYLMLNVKEARDKYRKNKEFRNQKNIRSSETDKSVF